MIITKILVTAIKEVWYEKDVEKNFNNHKYCDFMCYGVCGWGTGK